MEELVISYINKIEKMNIFGAIQSLVELFPPGLFHILTACN